MDKIAQFNPEDKIDYTPYANEFAKLGDDPERIVLIHNFIDVEDLKIIYNYLAITF